jgi:putative DNA primase/helicase
MRQAQDETQDGVDDRVRLLLAYLNAILKRRTDLQRFLEAIGPGGSGKGTYAKLAMGLVGCENAHVTTLQRLETNRFETAEILGKRLVLITDAEAYAGSVAILKALVGADPLPGERKYAIESRHFIPEALVIVATNEAVQSADYTSGLQRRRLSLPFPYTPDVPRCLLDFDGEVAVGEFAPYLAGLVNEALTIPDDEVTALIRHTPLVIPSLRDAWRRSMAETNPLAAWADEQLVLDPGAQTYIGKAERDSRTGRFAHTNDWLYPSYRADCDGAGVSKPVSLQRFRRLLMDFCQRQLKLQGLADGKDVGGAYVLGLRLRCVTEGGRGLMDQTLVADGVDASDELFNKYKEEQGNTIVPIGGDEQGAPPLMPYNGTPPENPSEPSTLSVARVSGRQLTAHIHQHRHQRPTNGTGQRSRSQGGRDWPYPRPRNDRWRR